MKSAKAEYAASLYWKADKLEEKAEKIRNVELKEALDPLTHEELSEFVELTNPKA